MAGRAYISFIVTRDSSAAEGVLEGLKYRVIYHDRQELGGPPVRVLRGLLTRERLNLQTGAVLI